MSIPEPDELLPEVRPLLLIARAAVRHGIMKARQYFDAEGQPADSSLAPNIVRYQAGLYLDNAGHVAYELEQDYGRPLASNNGLRLSFKHFRFIIRKSEEGELPVPSSDSQEKFYAHNASFEFMSLTDQEIHLVVLWDADHAYADLISFDLVLPRAGGQSRELTSAFWYYPILNLSDSAAEDDLPIEPLDDQQAQSGDIDE